MSKTTKTLSFAVATILFGQIYGAVSPLAAQPQSQQNQSVADAARRARQHKKTAPKEDRVWDNDSLPTTGSGVNTIGPAPEPPTTQNSPVRNARPAASGPSSTNLANDAQAIDKQRIEATAQMNALKDQLAEAQRVLDLAQRAFTLQRETYYSKTNYAEDKAGKARLDASQADILDKQAAVEALKAKLAALEDKLRALPSAPARQDNAPPAAPLQPAPPPSQPVPPVPPQ